MTAQASELILERWIGRLCNHITQLCHGIHLAEQTHSRLAVPPHDGLLETRGFDFTGGRPCQTTLTGDFFYPDREPLCDVPLGWNERRRILRTYIRPLLPERLFPDVGEDGLVIHIRSGDIFGKPAGDVENAGRLASVPILGWLRRQWRERRAFIHPNFVQPPLPFYRRVIDSRPWSRVRIVAQDEKNPVIPELLRSYGSIEFQPRDLETDISLLLAARNLAVGYGTFGVTWALLSSHLEGIFSPLVPALFGELRPGDLDGVRVQSYRFEGYIPHGQWKATEAQRQLMLTLAERNVVAVEASR
jgi:hypothetical protein